MSRLVICVSLAIELVSAMRSLTDQDEASFADLFDQRVVIGACARERVQILPARD